MTDALTAEELAAFRDLEWQVARTRRAVEQYEDREQEREGKGPALVESARRALDRSVQVWVGHYLPLDEVAEIYTQPDCLFRYCPTEDICKDVGGCVTPAMTRPVPEGETT